MKICLDSICFSIIFSNHALDRMKERNIDLEDIIESLSSPVQLLYDAWNDLYIAVAGKGSAIVYAFRGGYLEIVTVLGKREFNVLLKKYGNKRYKVMG
ncbi:DUF4258 domain-containing protein [Desulfurococcaceae archaeon MEX13E-LK6-19]|nr:DUF4258 domain-containing protein [Desulfurococcaceae archaeon MEX13E-LK6-19]